MRGPARTLVLAASLALAAPAAADPTWLPPEPRPASLQMLGTDGLGGIAALTQARFSSTITAHDRPAGPGQAFAPVGTLSENITGETGMHAEDDGDLLAVWTTSQYDLTFSERPQGEAWTTPVKLTTTARQVDVGLAPNGQAAVTWNADGHVLATWRTAPGVWAPPVELSASTLSPPKVAVALDGTVTIVWRQLHDEDGSAIWQRTKPAGSDTFEPAQRLSSGAHPTEDGLNDGHVHHPDVGIAPDGRAFAVWSHDAGYCTDHAVVPQCPGGGSEVESIEYAERAAGATTFGGAEQTAIGELNINEAPELAVARDGSVSITYRRDSGLNYPYDGPEENALVALTREAGESGWDRQVLTQASAGGDALFAGRNGDVFAVWVQRPPNEDETTHIARRAAGESSFTMIDGASTERGNSGYELFVSGEGDVLHWGADIQVVDVAGPRIRAVTLPAEVHAGRPATLEADVLDTWSALGDVTWTFADGSTQTGTSVTHTFGAEGEEDVTIVAEDEHGNVTERTERITVAAAPDEQAPAIELRAPAMGARVRQGEDVRADYACTDDRGVATCAGPVASGERLDTATLGAHDFTVIARDAAGNEATATHTYVVDPVPAGDEESPQIDIRTPRVGQRFTQGEVVRADFACDDDRVVTDCDGNVDDGALLETRRLGAHSVRVEARDGAGHETTRTHGYFVDPAPAPGAPRPPAPSPPPSSPGLVERDAEGNAGIAPGGVSGSTLAGGGLSQIIRASQPGTTIIGIIAGAPVVSAGGGNVISPGSGNVISPGSGNVISAGSGNVISAGSGNVISAGSGNFQPRAAGMIARAAALAGEALGRVAEGGHTFAQPGEALLHVKPTAAGRKALEAERRRARRDRAQGRKVRDLELTYSLVTGFADGRTPPVVATRTLTIDLLHRFVQTRGTRRGLGYDVQRHRNGRTYRRYENGDVVRRR